MTPLETLAWLKVTRRAIADGRDIPDTYGELKPRHLPDLRIILPRPEETSA